MKYLLFSLSSILFFPGLLYATHIAMMAKMVVNPGKDWIEVEVSITNKGDEDALVVSPQLKLGREEIMLSHLPRLGPNNSYRWTHRFEIMKLGFKLNGAYPLFLKTHYHDANFYPFSMPEIILMHYKVVPSTPLIKGALSVGDINNTGRAEVRLINPLHDDLSVTVELFLPNELVSHTPETRFQMAAGRDAKAPFRLENRWALQGSSYRVYAVAQWIYAGMHHTLVLPEMIKVTGNRMIKKNVHRIIGGIVFLIILFIVTLYFELERATRENVPE